MKFYLNECLERKIQNIESKKKINEVYDDADYDYDAELSAAWERDDTMADADDEQYYRDLESEEFLQYQERFKPDYFLKINGLHIIKAVPESTDGYKYVFESNIENLPNSKENKMLYNAIYGIAQLETDRGEYEFIPEESSAVEDFWKISWIRLILPEDMYKESNNIPEAILDGNLQILVNVDHHHCDINLKLAIFEDAFRHNSQVTDQEILDTVIDFINSYNGNFEIEVND